MARARNIKPSFFMNEELAELPVETRLLFIGLWTLADREGRMEDRPKRIKMSIFPADQFDVESMLHDLQTSGFINRYEVAGCRFIEVTNFIKHQDPHYREKASVIPPPPGKQNQIIATNVTRAQRARILERDGYKCQQCGATEHPCIDHIVPVSRGGDSSDDNLQVLCLSCNTKKGNYLSERRPDVESKQSPNDLLNPDSLIPESGFLNPEDGESLDHKAMFAEFWDRFPKGFGDKGSRKNAEAAYLKLKPDKALSERILAALDAQVLDKSTKAANGQFASDFQHVERWIRNQRWTDELSNQPARSSKRSKSDEADDAYAQQLARIAGGNPQCDAGSKGDGIDYLPAEQH